uniref:Uncharacterized protein n=1 Tax=Anguilla anguilla TaxID=7936 RepID=A0A0E9ULA8_ANGAN
MGCVDGATCCLRHRCLVQEALRPQVALYTWSTDIQSNPIRHNFNPIRHNITQLDTTQLYTM